MSRLDKSPTANKLSARTTLQEIGFPVRSWRVFSGTVMLIVVELLRLFHVRPVGRFSLIDKTPKILKRMTFVFRLNCPMCEDFERSDVRMMAVGKMEIGTKTAPRIYRITIDTKTTSVSEASECTCCAQNVCDFASIMTRLRDASVGRHYLHHLSSGAFHGVGSIRNLRFCPENP
jgi:hypothetical protein